MNTFETSAVVGDHGQVRITGVPFAKGTQVQISISTESGIERASTDIDEDQLVAARSRMKELFRSVKGFRMAPKIAREDLYDRRSVDGS